MVREHGRPGRRRGGCGMSGVANGRTCRLCGTPLRHTFVDLGMSPLCESFLTRRAARRRWSPSIRCTSASASECLLVQLERVRAGRARSSATTPTSRRTPTRGSSTPRRYAEMMIERLGLGAEQPRRRARAQRRLPAPALRRARHSRRSASSPRRTSPRRRSSAGVETLVDVLRRRDSRASSSPRARRADLIVGNNVLAQVPDLNDFVAGIEILLAPARRRHDRVPAPRAADRGQPVRHDLPRALLVLLAHDARAALRRPRARGVRRRGAPDPRRLAADLRAARDDDAHRGRAPPSHALPARESGARLRPTRRLRALRPSGSSETKWRAARVPDRRSGATASSVVGYGAPGKGNTLLNYCGIRTDLLDYTVDRNPYKQGRFLPGTHIPIYAPERIAETRPDYILILPWNLKRRDRRAARVRLASGARSSSCRSRVRSAPWPVPRRADEGRDLLRRPRPAHARDGAAHPEADDPDRRHADPLAHHEVLRALRAHRLHPLPRATRPTSIKEYFLTLQRGALERLRALATAGEQIELLQRDIHDWRSRSSNTGLQASDRPAAQDGRSRTSATTRSSSRPTATG